MGWYVAPCLNMLLSEFNAMAPTRNKAADGSIGDASHQARPSDHNPDWRAGGVVRARDITNDPPKLDVHKEFRKPDINLDPRKKYWISNGQICSSYPIGMTPANVPRPYHGSNPHRHHGHMSCRDGKIYENDTTPWYGVGQEEKLDAETKARFDEQQKELDAIQAALGPDYGASISKSLIKARRNPDGTFIRDSQGNIVYDEHLDVLEDKQDELAMHIGVLVEQVTTLTLQVQQLIDGSNGG